MSKKDPMDCWPTSTRRSLKSHEKTANDHLRKSERYEMGYHKDGALKRASECIRFCNNIHREMGNDKAMYRLLDALPQSPSKKRSGGGDRALRDFANFMSRPMFGRRGKKSIW
jgi:hypothetical protein